MEEEDPGLLEEEGSSKQQAAKKEQKVKLDTSSKNSLYRDWILFDFHTLVFKMKYTQYM